MPSTMATARPTAPQRRRRASATPSAEGSNLAFTLPAVRPAESLSGTSTGMSPAVSVGARPAMATSATRAPPASTISTTTNRPLTAPAGEEASRSRKRCTAAWSASPASSSRCSSSRSSPADCWARSVTSCAVRPCSRATTAAVATAATTAVAAATRTRSIRWIDRSRAMRPPRGAAPGGVTPGQGKPAAPGRQRKGARPQGRAPRAAALPWVSRPARRRPPRRTTGRCPRPGSGRW